MYKENYESGGSYSENLHFNDEAKEAYTNPVDNVFGAGYRVPEIDVGDF